MGAAFFSSFRGLDDRRGLDGYGGVGRSDRRGDRSLDWRFLGEEELLRGTVDDVVLVEDEEDEPEEDEEEQDDKVYDDAFCCCCCWSQTDFFDVWLVGGQG